MWHIYKVRHTICVYLSGDGIYTCIFINLTAIFVSIFNYLLDDFSYHALSNERQPYHHISHWISKVFVVVVNVWYLDLQLLVHSVPITTKVVSSNHALDELYLIQHYEIKWFATGRWFSPQNKTDRHDIAEIVLKVALSNISPSLVFKVSRVVFYILYTFENSTKPC